MIQANFHEEYEYEEAIASIKRNGLMDAVSSKGKDGNGWFIVFCRDLVRIYPNSRTGVEVRYRGIVMVATSVASLEG